VTATDKPTVVVTHYALNNLPGGDYYVTENSYDALKTISGNSDPVQIIHGHTHGNRGFDVGRQSTGPFGYPYYCAGHISGGESVYTYGQPPNENLFAWGDFYHPRRFQIDNNLNTINRQNHATDGTNDGGLWHPRSPIVGMRETRTLNLTNDGLTTDGSGQSESKIVRGYDRTFGFSTGTTAGSYFNGFFRLRNIPDPRWEILVGFSVRADVPTVGGDNSFRSRVSHGGHPYGGGANSGYEWYGYKIEDGQLYGEIGSGGSATTTTALTSVTAGDVLHLGALLFSPHICRFYYHKDGSWNGAELTDGNFPRGATTFAKMANFSVYNKSSAQDYEVLFSDFKYHTMGN
jgi:hypothetical protein